MHLYLMLAFVLGVGAGIGLTVSLVPAIGATIEPQQSVTIKPPNTSDSVQIRSLQGALQEVELALKKELQTNALLKEELDETNDRLKIELAENQAKENASAARSERRRGRFEDSIARRLSVYTQAGNLRPEQTAALESIMAQYMANQNALREARENGTQAPPELDLNELVGTLLDADQVAAVETYREEIQQGRNETRATARMNRIAPALGLSEDQKDAVFGAYYNSISDQSEISTSNEGLSSAMSQILSPEQFEEWARMHSD